MNIAVISELRPTGFGGGEYEIFKFMKGLSLRGHNVSFFFISNKTFYSYRSENFSIFYKPYLDFKYMSKFNEIIDKYYQVRVAERFLAKNRENLDYIIGVQTHSAILASKYGEKYGIRVANFVFETPTLACKNPYVRKAFDNNKKFVKLWSDFGSSLLKSDIILANAKITSDSVVKWIGRRANHVYNSISVSDTIEIFNLKLDYNGSVEDRVIYVGRLAKHKNVDQIIKALNQIENAPKLIIIGNGPELQYLKDLSAKLNVNCEFLGNVTEEEKFIAISRSKFMIFPSCFEGFGIPPSEALAMGRPCVSSDLEIFKKNYGSSLDYFKTNDIESLRNRMIKLIIDKDYCLKRGFEGKKFIQKSSVWNDSVKKLESVLIDGIR